MLEKTVKGDPGPSPFENSSFLKSIFGGNEQGGRLAEGKGTDSATAVSSSLTEWEVGWYSERFSVT